MPASRPTEAQIKRAIRAAEACGLPIRGVETQHDGTVRVLVGPPEQPVAFTSAQAEESAWDERFGVGR